MDRRRGDPSGLPPPGHCADDDLRGLPTSGKRAVRVGLVDHGLVRYAQGDVPDAGIRTGGRGSRLRSRVIAPSRILHTKLPDCAPWTSDFGGKSPSSPPRARGWARPPHSPPFGGAAEAASGRVTPPHPRP